MFHIAIATSQRLGWLDELSCRWPLRGVCQALCFRHWCWRASCLQSCLERGRPGAWRLTTSSGGCGRQAWPCWALWQYLRSSGGRFSAATLSCPPPSPQCQVRETAPRMSTMHELAGVAMARCAMRCSVCTGGHGRAGGPFWPTAGALGRALSVDSHNAVLLPAGGAARGQSESP
jgi:hypothetical protein